MKQEEGEEEGGEEREGGEKTVELFAVGRIVWPYSRDDSASASAEAFKVF